VFSALPTPLEMTALGTALIVGAGLVFWFLKSVQIAMYMALAAGALFLCATVAYGYEQLGEAKIQPKLDAALAQLAKLDAEATQFRSDAMVARDAAVATIRSKNAAIATLTAKVKEGLDAQNPVVANTVVPSDAVVWINTHIASANVAAFGAGTGDEATAAAAHAVAGTVRQWEEWGAECADKYSATVIELNAVQDYYARLVTSSAANSSTK
jgi:hypothetical protein